MGVIDVDSEFTAQRGDQRMRLMGRVSLRIQQRGVADEGNKEGCCRHGDQ